MPIIPAGEPLIGRRIRLDLLTEADSDELYPLLAGPAVYAGGYATHRRRVSLDDVRDLVRSVFLAGQGKAGGAGGGRTGYAIRLAAGAGLGAAGPLAGMSSPTEADPRHKSIHLGCTFHGRRWWGAQVNPEAKLLLLAHCFGDCGYGRVKIQADAVNTRSQAAIIKLGAQREGAPRRHLRWEDGTFRDTIVFSVLKDEWPQVKAGLAARVG